MATVTNKTLNTSTVTNKEHTTNSRTFDDTDPITFAEMSGTFDNPQDLKNKSISTVATVTNKPAN